MSALEQLFEKQRQKKLRVKNNWLSRVPTENISACKEEEKR